MDRSHCPEPTLTGIRNLLLENKVDFEIIPFTSREESVQAVESALSEGFDTLIMGGGDGTIHNLFNLAFEKGFTFGIIPLGTVNALARSLGIPLDPLAACRTLLQGHVRKIDVGRLAGYWFTCFASIGFDASVVHTINEQSKIRWKKAAFVLQGIRRLFRLGEISPIELKILPSEKVFNGYSVMISNIPVYAGVRMFSDQPDNGKMELILFKRNRISDYLAGAIQMLLKIPFGDDRDKRLLRSDLGGLIISSSDKIFLQLDGEAIAVEPGSDLTLEILPKAAEFLAPR